MKHILPRLFQEAAAKPNNNEIPSTETYSTFWTVLQFKLVNVVCVDGACRHCRHRVPEIILPKIET